MIDLTSLLSTQNPMLKTKPLDLGGSASFSILYGSSLNVAVSAEKTPLSLAYQTAIDRINEKVAPYLGENALARGIEDKVDLSPEATADRIVSRSTALYSRFEKRHVNEVPQAVLDRFIDTIRGGIEEGFSEATEILSSLGVFEGDIEANVKLTFDLIVEKLAVYHSQKLEVLNEQ